MAAELSKHGTCVLVEAGSIGSSGATSYSKGMVRVFDKDESLVEWNYEGAIRWLDKFGDEASDQIYYPRGSLYLLTNKDLPLANRIIDQYDSNRYPITYLTHQEISSKFPYLNTNDIDFAVYEPKGGFGIPTKAARHLSEIAQINGCLVIENSKVFGLKNGINHQSVVLEHGSICAKKVVLTCGAFTNNLIKIEKINTKTIPMSYFMDDGSFKSPCIINDALGCYVRPDIEQGFYLGGMRQEEYSSPESIRQNSSEIADQARLLCQKMFRKENKFECISSFIGFDSYSKNLKPTIHSIESNDNQYLFGGFSGRGFKYSLYIAEIYSKKLMQLSSINATDLSGVA